MQNYLLRILHIANRAFDFIILMLMLLIASLGIYFIWNAGNTYSQAQSRVYRQYKPSVEDDALSFKELVRINQDVKAWISIYDTGIDYPIVQGRDNSHYLNRDAEDKYSTSGSIFIDSMCSPDFSDFNTIIYGHHMAHGVMFGDLEKFEAEDFFKSHKWGSIYCNGKEKEIKLYAFIDSVDGYDKTIYSYGIENTEDKRSYLNYLAEHAKYFRNIGVSSNDRIVLLSTCSHSMTNGRYILVGAFRERDKALAEKTREVVGTTRSKKIKVLIILEVILAIILVILLRKKKAKRWK